MKILREGFGKIKNEKLCFCEYIHKNEHNKFSILKYLKKKVKICANQAFIQLKIHS